MPISTDIRIESLLAKFRSARTRRAETETSRTADPRATNASGDRVEISLSAKMTVEAINGILNDSVVEQINKAIQEAGIDLTVEEAATSGMDLSPEATARRIADFATGFEGAYSAAYTDVEPRTRITGFMSLIRGAIEEGFTHARDFLNGIKKLSDQMNESIDRTYELTSQYLEEFHAAQLDYIQANPPSMEEDV